jgi:hypothetical protein
MFRYSGTWLLKAYPSCHCTDEIYSTQIRFFSYNISLSVQMRTAVRDVQELDQ